MERAKTVIKNSGAKLDGCRSTEDYVNTLGKIYESGLEKSKRIKAAVKVKKDVEKLEKQSEESIKKFKPMVARSDLVGPTKNLRDIKSTNRDADKLVKESLKTGFKKGGPVDKKKKKKKFPDLTGDGKVTFADVLKGRGVINGKKKKKKVI